MRNSNNQTGAFFLTMLFTRGSTQQSASGRLARPDRSVARAICVGCGVLAALASCGGASAAPIPKLQRNGGAIQLMLDGAPYTALGGEVHNSSSSSVQYMQPIWDHLAALHVNTVITPVTWQLLEPQENQFNYALVDEQLKQARVRNMRLVLLWFGAYKNAKSTYAPGWVRADPRRFPRAEIRPTKAFLAAGAAPISVFSDAAVEADARAFDHLLDHLRQVDPDHTVIAVQVENETGLLGDSRDRSALADAAWRSPVPAPLMAYLNHHRGRLQPSVEAVWARNGHRQAGTWAEVFGADWQAEEIFMAWGFARYVDRVAAAGKAELPLPMYANAWLGPQKPTDVAGLYPSGGPVPRTLDVWKAGAPHLDWLSPDIYVDDFSAWARAYDRPDNPLFIPEARFLAGNLFEALGMEKAIAFSPFGIEDGRVGNEIAQAYDALSGMGAIVAEAQAQGRIFGAAVKVGETKEATLGDYTVTLRSAVDVMRTRALDAGVQMPDVKVPSEPQTDQQGWLAARSDPRGSALVVMLGPDDFAVLGRGVDVQLVRRGTASEAEIDSLEEGRFIGGQWTPGRTLNGDELYLPMPFDSVGLRRFRLIRSRR